MTDSLQLPSNGSLSKKRHIPLGVAILACTTSLGEVARAWLQDTAHKKVAAKISLAHQAQFRAVREKLADVSTTMRDLDDENDTLREKVAGLIATVDMLTLGKRRAAREHFPEKTEPSVGARLRAARRHVTLSELVPPEEMPAPPDEMVQKTLKGLYDDD